MFGGGRSSSRIDAATVYLRAETGEFNAKLDQAERNWLESTRSMSREALKLELAQERLLRTLKRYPPESAQAKRALVGLKEAEENLIRSAQRADGAINRQGTSLIQQAKRLAIYTGGVYALGRAFISTVTIAGQYQRSMNILEAVSGATADQMRRAGEEAKRLGADVTLPATSAEDAARAMTNMAKAGLDIESSIRGTEGVLRLAAAAMIDVDQASKITARSIQAFGLASSDATKVADVFAAVANASSGEIPDFALALSQASNVANSWNLTLEETIATLGIFANNAIIGSDAGTSLRVMLSRLVPVSVRAKEAYEELNVSAFEKGTGKIKPYRQILMELHGAFKTLTEEEKKLYVQTIFGQDAQRAAGIAILKTIENYDVMLEKVSEVGAATKLSKAINEGYAGSLDAFKSSVETLQISIGEKLLPTLTEGVLDLKDWVDGLTESGEAGDELAKAVDDVAGVVRGFAGAIRGAYKTIRPLIDLMGGVENATKAALGLWVVYRLRIIAAGFGLVRTSAFGAAAGIDAVAAAEARAAAAGGAAAGRRGVPFIGWNLPTAAVVGGVLAYNAASGSPNQAAGGFGEPVGRTRDGRLVYQRGGKVYVRGKGPGAGRAITIRGGNGQPITLYEYDASLVGPRPGDIVAPGEGNLGGPGGSVPKAGGGRSPDPGAGKGDGLSQIQRLEEAAMRAELTTSQQDDLSAARAIADYYRKVAADEDLKGDDLFKARQDYLNAASRVKSIEDQIAAERAQNEAEAQRKREQRAAKLKAERQKQARFFKRQADIVDKELGTGPYSNVGDDFSKVGVGPAFAEAANKKLRDRLEREKGKDKDVVTREDLDRVAKDLIMGFAEIQKKYAPNFALGTHVMEHLTREQTGVLREIAAPRRFRDSIGLREQGEAVMS